MADQLIRQVQGRPEKGKAPDGISIGRIDVMVSMCVKGASLVKARGQPIERHP